MHNINSMSSSQYHAQLRTPEKDHAIKGLVVCYDPDLEHLDLLNGVALGCQPFPDVCIV